MMIRPMNSNPASAGSFSLANHWLQTCLTTHQGCRKPDTSFMPTRVIEIQVKRDLYYLRLRETNHEIKEPYAALSYCWGGEKHGKTTNDNIHRHRMRINMGDLPPTLRDAVVVAHKIGIRLLWIDSLCILQDDVYDKAVEISQMPRVYSQATVTITASRAKGVQEGFLFDRPKIDRDNPKLAFKLQLLQYILGKNMENIILPAVERADDIEPLHLRAWDPSRAISFFSNFGVWLIQHTMDMPNPRAN